MRLYKRNTLFGAAGQTFQKKPITFKYESPFAISIVVSLCRCLSWNKSTFLQFKTSKANDYYHFYKIVKKAT